MAVNLIETFGAAEESTQDRITIYILVYSFVDGDALAERLPEIRELLHRMGRTLNQGEVVVEVNDSFYKIRDFDV